MLRIVIKETFQNSPDSCGRRYRTFDVDAPEIEKYIADAYGQCEVIAVEFLPAVRRDKRSVE